MKRSNHSASRKTTAEANRKSPLKYWIALASLLALNGGFLYFVNVVSYSKDDVSLIFSVQPDTTSNHTGTGDPLLSISTPSVSHLRSESGESEFAKEAKETQERAQLHDEIPVSHHSVTEVAPEATAKKQQKLNVMVFYPDDWRHDTIGAAGTQPVKTPFLDQLSREGIRFTHNCVTTSICWISRATMFTGQYLSRHKSQRVRDPVFYKAWNESYIYTMQQNGYFVGHIGKWQFRDDGFVKDHYNWSSLYEGSHWYHSRGEKTHSTVRDEREAIRFLRERPKDAPFVLTTAFYAPKAVGEGAEQHFPMDKTEHLYDNVTIPEPLDPEWAFQQLPKFMQDNSYYLEARRRYKQRFDFNVTGMYDRFQRKYYRMVSEVDEAIKNVVDELESQGLLNSTLIIFTTGT